MGRPARPGRGPGETLGLRRGPPVCPKKTLGQNFCVDPALFREVLERLAPRPGEEIWEIGPGPGDLTARLAETGLPVRAFELDERLRTPLSDRFPAGVRFAWGDFLTIPLEPLIPAGRPLVICGNLPYYCATPMIRRALWLEPPPRRLVFVIQEEVARKAVAAPDTRDYGFLSAQLQLFADLRLGSVFPPSAFFPRPKVSSAILEIAPRRFPEDETRVRRVALRLLSLMLRERRKMAINLLGRAIPIPWEEQFARCGLPRGIRGEAIPLDTLLRLADGLPAGAVPDDPRLARGE